MGFTVLTNDQKVHVVGSLQDVLELVKQYAGEEISEYLKENIRSCEDLDRAFDEMYETHQKEIQAIRQHQNLVLRSIQEAAKEIDGLLDVKRISAERVKEITAQIWKTCGTEMT